jgi:hypothetical protein
MPVVHSDPLAGEAAGVAEERHVLGLNSRVVGHFAVDVYRRDNPRLAVRNDEVIGPKSRVGPVGRVTPPRRNHVSERPVVALVVEEWGPLPGLGIGLRRQPDSAQSRSDEATTSRTLTNGSFIAPSSRPWADKP